MMDAFEVLAKLAEHGTPPDGDIALRMSVGLEDTLRRFERETLPFIASGGAEIRFCYAPYGRGKTHFLKSIQALARKYGFVTAYVDCRAEQPPFATFADTYRMIAARAVPPDDDDGRGIEAVIEARLNDEAKGSIIGALRKEDRFEEGFRNLVIGYVRAVLAENEGLIQTLGDLLKATPTYRFPMSVLYRIYKNLPRPIGKLSARNAPFWIRSLGALPSALQYPGFVILFDETEKSYHMAKWSIRKQQQHLANIRNLVDHVAMGMFKGCAFCFAVVEEFRELAQTNLEALAQRIERIYSDHANPRAVWTSLDELTNPSPDRPEFFKAVGEKVIALAISAGMDESHATSLRQTFSDMALSSAQNISIGAVREFVKSAAAQAAFLVTSDGGSDA
ncbi:MAG: BREX system ATP-binding domain-containing protein [Desulfomonilaceae bacterium]